MHTIKNYTDIFQCTEDTARRIIDILQLNSDEARESLLDYPAVRQLYSHDDVDYMKLLAIDSLLDCTFGVEGRAEHNYNYLNIGESYATTLCYCGNSGSYFLCSWADMEESAERDNDL